MNNQTTTTIKAAELDNHNSNQICTACQEQRIDKLIARRQSEPVTVARNMKSSAKWIRLMANLLLAVEVCSLFAVAQTTFENGLIGPFTVAILYVAIIAVLTGLALSKASRDVKPNLIWGFIVVGMLLALAGMGGFALLRTSIFSVSLMGGAINYGQVSLGNALLMVGLTLGVPLIIGALHDDASEKLFRADVMLADIEEQKRAAS